MVVALPEVVFIGTTAEISCNVTGLTGALQTVKWEKSDGTDVTSDVPGYTSNDGVYDNGSQTTTLTVDGELNTVDSTYNCLITPSTQDDATEVSTAVTLSVFSEFIN